MLVDLHPHLVVERQGEEPPRRGVGPGDDVGADAMVSDIEEADLARRPAQGARHGDVRRPIRRQQRADIDYRDVGDVDRLHIGVVHQAPLA